MNTSSWNWLGTLLEQIGVMPKMWRNNLVNDSSISSTTTTPETCCESDYEKLRKKIDDLGDYDHHDILRRTNEKGWCAWHLDIKANENAIKIAQAFHENKAKLKLSSNITGTVDTIEEMVSKLKLGNSNKKYIENCLAQVRKDRELSPIITIYTMSQQVSRRLNRCLALNTFHTLNFYCTLLNCPALAETEEYTETFTNVLFHPQFEKYIVRKKTVYRGFWLQDKKFIESYKEGATIITTTVLSTSENPAVAESFIADLPQDQLAILCIYNINNVKRRTALKLREISYYQDEDEVLILPYIPFIIQSVKQLDNGHRMEVFFKECDDNLETV